MTEASRALQGLRILVVEDNFLIAEMLQAFLLDRGCIVVGPVGRVAAALTAVDAELDGALLDMNLAGEYCFPIATRLEELDVPFVFVTGYDDERIIPVEFRSVPRLSKPLDDTRAEKVMANHFG